MLQGIITRVGKQLFLICLIHKTGPDILANTYHVNVKCLFPSIHIQIRNNKEEHEEDDPPLMSQHVQAQLLILDPGHSGNRFWELL